MQYVDWNLNNYLFKPVCVCIVPTSDLGRHRISSYLVCKGFPSLNMGCVVIRLVDFLKWSFNFLFSYFTREITDLNNKNIDGKLFFQRTRWRSIQLKVVSFSMRKSGISLENWKKQKKEQWRRQAHLPGIPGSGWYANSRGRIDRPWNYLILPSVPVSP